jgi:predicted acylesterase/phospholipase RssA
MQELIRTQLGDADARMADIRLENPVDGEKSCPTFVVAKRASAAEAQAVLFRTYNCGEFYDADECKIWEAARCTSAAPTFFKPMFVRVPPGPGQWYVDGGLQHNNPSQLALDEAQRIWPQVKRFCLVSIGTGWQRNVEFIESKESQAPGPPAKRKRVSWQFVNVMNVPKASIELAKIAKCAVELSTSSELTHQQLSDKSNSRDLAQQFPYYRFNVERGMDSIELQEWKAMVRIEELTARYIAEGDNERKKRACAEILWKPHEVERM